GTAADHGIELRLHDDEGETDAVGLDAGSLKGDFQFLARELTAAAQGPNDRALASAKHGRIEFEPPVVNRYRGADARRCERKHPTDVIGRNEVPRRPHDMGAEDPSVAE